MAGEPTINPYAPPAASLEAPATGPVEDRFDRPLFSSTQIGVAAFFATIFAGILLMQANFRVMRRTADANRTLWLGALVTVALIVGLFLVPKGARTPINIAAAIALYRLAGSLQGQAFFRHQIAGGAKRSNWLVFAVIVGTFVGLMAAILAITVAFRLLDF